MILTDAPQRHTLEIVDLQMRFGGLHVLDGISFSAQSGQVLALIGPNGAGKTTLFNIIAGVLRPKAGRVLLDGRDVTDLPAHKRCATGIARTFQIPQPFGELSVLENIEVAIRFGSQVNLDARRERADHWLEAMHLARWRDAPAYTLPLGARKRLELVRALATGPAVILLDEVMGGLAPEEVDEVSAIINALRDENLVIIFVEHVMRAVMQVADQVVVLHQGHLIATGEPESIANNKEVVRAYLGSRAEELQKQ